MSDMIRIFDTTLRDGEQSPGCSMNVQEKIEVAKALERLHVDVIEAGFPASSPGDLESVKTIAELIKDSTVCALCRTLPRDVDAAWKALSKAASPPRLHLFSSSSPLHLEYILKMTQEQAIEHAVAAVKYAKTLCSDIEFSPQDATRSDLDFVARLFSAVIEAGATTINFPDTVGYAMPDEFAGMIKYVRERVKGIEKVNFSVHVHNDLGVGVANSLAAIGAGANQVECTINGIGERAGNAALEEIVMALKVREDYWKKTTRIDTTQLYPLSRMVTKVTGVKVQPHKAIVGENAFAHESGVHQHGVLAKRETYEIMTPESVGIPKNEMVLGKHSGRHAFEERLRQLGLVVEPAALTDIFMQFKLLADKKKTVSDRDIEALVLGTTSSAVPPAWKLERWVTNADATGSAMSAVRLVAHDGGLREAVHLGNGCVDAAFSAINDIVGKDVTMEMFELGAINGSSDSQGEAMVKVSWNGKQWNGRGVSTNIVESAIKAYVAAINAMEAEKPGK